MYGSELCDFIFLTSYRITKYYHKNMNEYDQNHQEISSESLESKLNQLNLSSSSSFDINSNDYDDEQIPVSIDSTTITQPVNVSHQTEYDSFAEQKANIFF